MPKVDFKLPTGELVTVIYGVKYPAKGTTYLQGMRSGRITEEHPEAREYHGMEKVYADQLAAAVAAEITEADAIVSPPSSREDAKPFREAILRKVNTTPLGGTFSRKEKRKAADAKTVEEMVEEFEYRAGDNEPDLKSIIVVDESIATGKTIAATLNHLRQTGMLKDCRVVVAVWGLLQD
jgi:ABC-type uncharacterized transport system ATPase subunit